MTYAAAPSVSGPDAVSGPDTQQNVDRPPAGRAPDRALASATLAELVDAIGRRKSCRNYEAAVPPEEVLSFVREWLVERANLTAPLGTHPQIELLTETAAAEGDSKVSTYGYIRGFQAALAVVSANEPRAIFDAGYAAHGLVLELTQQGLDTVWIGGAFNQSHALRNVETKAGNLVAGLIPFGRSAKKRHLRGVLIPKLLNAQDRRPLDQVCFVGDFSRGLGDDAIPFRAPLDLARRAPSAKNKQPWRLVVTEDLARIHLYAEFTQRGSVGTGWRHYACPPEYLDLGIFARGLTIAMKHAGFDGVIARDEPKLTLPQGADMEYLATWFAR